MFIFDNRQAQVFPLDVLVLPKLLLKLAQILRRHLLVHGKRIAPVLQQLQHGPADPEQPRRPVHGLDAAMLSCASPRVPLSDGI
jgi:hypothetical protein